MSPQNRNVPSVLIVDGLDEHRSLLSRAFQDLDCRVFAVTTPNAAVGLLETKPVDLAVLDVPTCQELLGQIIAFVGTSRAVIISVDPDFDLADQHQCIYYQKPFSPTAFAREVSERVLTAWEKPVPRKLPSATSVGTASTALESMQRLQAALLQCGACHDWCPGVSSCGKVKSILRPPVKNGDLVA